jgi:hypothetical protein
MAAVDAMTQREKKSFGATVRRAVKRSTWRDRLKNTSRQSHSVHMRMYTTPHMMMMHTHVWRTLVYAS